jgi:hypothetical protein
VSLPEVHRQIVDWLRLEGAKELLLPELRERLRREFMTVPEQVPA